MCEPVIMASLAVASTGFQIYQTNESAKSQFKAQHAQAEQALEEQQASATEDLGARMKEFRKTRARARVAGGESGAQGQSFAVALNQNLQDAGIQSGIIGKNLSLQQRSTLTDLESANARVRTVSGLEAGLRIASSGLGAYNAAKAVPGTVTPTPASFKLPPALSSSTTSRLPQAGTVLS